GGWSFWFVSRVRILRRRCTADYRFGDYPDATTVRRAERGADVASALAVVAAATKLRIVPWSFQAGVARGPFGSFRSRWSGEPAPADLAHIQNSPPRSASALATAVRICLDGRRRFSSQGSRRLP